jgi:AbrB family looped-hinge helix DNA binding protein
MMAISKVGVASSPRKAMERCAIIEGLTFTIDCTIVKHIKYRWRRCKMEAVTISPKFQIVIPRKIRDSLKLKPGLKVQVLVYGNRIELIPFKKISEMRGFLRGIRTEVDREPDRI